MEYGSGNSDCSPGLTPLALTVPCTHQPSPPGVSTQETQDLGHGAKLN